MRLFIVFLIFLFPLGVAAQDRDSYFDDYQTYAKFVDSRIMTGDYIELIQTLGGRDEYTIEQLQSINNRFHSIYPNNFASRGVIRETDLGDGFRQEIRVFWGNNTSYVYFFAMLHETNDELVVLTFRLNSDITKIVAEF